MEDYTKILSAITCKDNCQNTESVYVSFNQNIFYANRLSQAEMLEIVRLFKVAGHYEQMGLKIAAQATHYAAQVALNKAVVSL